MLRLLSWNSCEKFTTPDVRMFLPKQESSSDMSSHSSPLTKRKHVAEEGETTAEHLTPFKSEASQTSAHPAAPLTHVSSTLNLKATEGLPTPLLSPTGMTGEENGPLMGSPSTSGRLQAMRQVIQTQLSLEILLKHKELRLIDQELAKCQISLEQLRRCTEIPYPQTRPCENVSAGKGPALRSSFSGKKPQSPAPWGVTDGPYTRHYAKWLLPDTRFDGGEPEIPLVSVSGKAPVKGRPIRGGFGEPGQIGVKSRSQRAGNLQSLPAGYGQPKEKASGPMILKRKSDGVMVKLSCPDCGRHDFGSPQGFINHCRIGHGRNFASHDAAAEACGEAVEYDQTGAIIGVEPSAPPAANNVHPLIRSARLLPPNSPANLLSAMGSTGGASHLKRKRSVKDSTSPHFRASSATPHLSALIQGKGLGLNLQDIVTDAKTKVELPESDFDDSDAEADTPVTETARGRHPQVAGTKQLTKPSKSPATSPILHSRMAMPAREEPRHVVAEGGNLRHDTVVGRLAAAPRTILRPIDPSPTSESTQAPSLIDDDEEFEAHSPTSTSISEDIEEGDVAFEVQDEDDGRQAVMPRPEFQPTCTQPATRPPSGRVRRPSALRRQLGEREEKHVSFVNTSPVVKEEQESPDGKVTKRRRISKG